MCDKTTKFASLHCSIGFCLCNFSLAIIHNSKTKARKLIKRWWIVTTLSLLCWKINSLSENHKNQVFCSVSKRIFSVHVRREGLQGFYLFEQKRQLTAVPTGIRMSHWPKTLLLTFFSWFYQQINPLFKHEFTTLLFSRRGLSSFPRKILNHENEPCWP